MNTSASSGRGSLRTYTSFAGALKQAAIGVTHLFARDKDGIWKEVIGSAAMARRLNNGGSFYGLTPRNPDVCALINLDRLCGSAIQRHRVRVESGLTLEELVAENWRSPT